VDSNQDKVQTALIVPCFNEASRLELARFRSFLESNADVKLVFVDDGSTDSTLDVLNDFCHEQPRQIEVLSLKNNCGKSEAIRQGFLHCSGGRRNRSGNSYRYLGFLDADLATPLNEMNRAVEIAQRRPDVALVSGSRIELSGHHVHRRRKRQLLGKAFSTVASMALGLSIRDTQCGAKLFRNTDKVRTVFRSPFLDRWLFDVEIFARLKIEFGKRCHDRIYEMPLESWREVEGSKLRARDFLKAPINLAKLIFFYRRWGAQYRQRMSSGPSVQPQVQAALTSPPNVIPMASAAVNKQGVVEVSQKTNKRAA